MSSSSPIELMMPVPHRLLTSPLNSSHRQQEVQPGKGDYAFEGAEFFRSRVASTASATASPSIGTPRMIPKIGPGNELAVKNSVLMKPYEF
jgi:hypothetical protein